MSGRSCPTGCGRPVARGKLMCAPCWSEVPKPLQTDVYRTWRAWRRQVGSGELMHAYSAAVDAAVASIP
jgi:hypothetical protein